MSGYRWIGPTPDHYVTDWHCPTCDGDFWFTVPRSKHDPRACDECGTAMTGYKKTWVVDPAEWGLE